MYIRAFTLYTHCHYTLFSVAGAHIIIMYMYVTYAHTINYIDYVHVGLEFSMINKSMYIYTYAMIRTCCVQVHVYNAYNIIVLKI